MDTDKEETPAPEQSEPEHENSIVKTEDCADITNSNPQVPDDIQTMIDTAPPEMRRTVQAFSAMVQSQTRSPKNGLFEKFSDAHIDKYLDYVQRDDDNAYNLKKTNRWFYLAYFAIALIAFGAAIVYLLPKDRDFLESLVQILITLAGGIGAGYGLKSRKDN